MPEILKVGTQVRLIQPVIEGKIVEAKIIDNALAYRVEYETADGVQERFFFSDELEVIS